MIRVYGGNRRLVRDNHNLGEIELPKLAPSSNITVTVAADADHNIAVDVRNESEYALLWYNQIISHTNQALLQRCPSHSATP